MKLYLQTQMNALRARNQEYYFENQRLKQKINRYATSLQLCRSNWKKSRDMLQTYRSTYDERINHLHAQHETFQLQLEEQTKKMNALRVAHEFQTKQRQQLGLTVEELHVQTETQQETIQELHSLHTKKEEHATLAKQHYKQKLTEMIQPLLNEPKSRRYPNPTKRLKM